MSYRFQVNGVTAQTIPAKVIELQPIEHGTTEVGECDLMSTELPGRIEVVVLDADISCAPRPSTSKFPAARLRH